MTIKLDLKDRKLIHLLDFDARAPLSRLAKRIGLSKQGTKYKMNRLMRLGVIKGFVPIINVPKLGYIYCRLSLTLSNITPEKEQEILDYIKHDPRWFWVFTTQGVYDLLFVMWAKSITEYKEAVLDIFSRFSAYIKYKNESITTDVVHFQHRWLLKESRTKEIHIQETPERIEIDDDDKRILSLLCEDARMSLTDMSRRIDLSPKTIANRIRGMEKNKLIEGYRPDLDHNKLGYTYYKLWINLNNISKEKMNRIYQYIKMNPIILYIVKGVGLPEDLDVEIMVKNNQELFDFVSDLRLKFPEMIGDYRTFMFYETVKIRYLPF
ncbi:Lrp/AsnC family transcriptional regulator [Candidatus Woesearchaeota archaeon]|nr:Lrp/AsnC family transcriptional regulator [Candidatus Woesearchaeota archaeon]